MGTSSRLLHPTFEPVNPLCSMSLPSRKSMRSPRPGTPYGLLTLFADSDEFDIRCSHELSAHERDLLRSSWASRTAAELVQLAASVSLSRTPNHHRVLNGEGAPQRSCWS